MTRTLLCLLALVISSTPQPTKTVPVVRKTLQSIVAPAGSVTLVTKDISLSWNAATNTDTLTVTGYNLYYGMESRFDNDGTWPSNYSNVIQLGNATNTPVLGLRGATTYYFAAAAIDQNGGVGDLSDEAIYTTPLVMDVVFAFSQPVTNVFLQWSPDFNQWIDLGTIPTNGTWRVTGDPNTRRFYRGRATSQ